MPYSLMQIFSSKHRNINYEREEEFGREDGLHVHINIKFVPTKRGIYILANCISHK